MINIEKETVEVYKLSSPIINMDLEISKNMEGKETVKLVSQQPMSLSNVIFEGISVGDFRSIVSMLNTLESTMDMNDELNTYHDIEFTIYPKKSK